MIITQGIFFSPCLSLSHLRLATQCVLVDRQPYFLLYNKIHVPKRVFRYNYRKPNFNPMSWSGRKIQCYLNKKMITLYRRIVFLRCDFPPRPRPRRRNLHKPLPPRPGPSCLDDLAAAAATAADYPASFRATLRMVGTVSSSFVRSFSRFSSSSVIYTYTHIHTHKHLHIHTHKHRHVYKSGILSHTNTLTSSPVFTGNFRIASRPSRGGGVIAPVAHTYTAGYSSAPAVFHF